jgi:uncharacterized integral membrane protein
MQIGFIVILIIAIFVAIFAIQNGTPVPIDLFLARYEMPLAVIMMSCLILGAVVVLLLGTVRQFKKGSQVKELKNKIKSLEEGKTQDDNSIKAMEMEIQTLKSDNVTLNEKISELEGKNKVQEDTILGLNEKVKSNVLETEIDGGSTDLDNEKNEAHSE